MSEDLSIRQEFEYRPSPVPPGGGSAPSARLRAAVENSPTSGDFSFDLTVNGVTETKTVPIPSTADEVAVIFRSHAHIQDNQITAYAATVEGLPSSDVVIIPRNGLKITDLIISNIDQTGMTGGFREAFVKFSR